MPQHDLVSRFKSHNRPWIIAHRGVSAYYPENTMPAIEEAIRIEADMVEVDVQISSDQIPVIAHDMNLVRTASNHGLISKMQWNELEKIDVGSWFHPRFSNARIPLLDQVLEVCKTRIPVNLELKFQERNTGKLFHQVKKVTDLISDHNMRSDILISGFNSRVSSIVKSLDRNIATAVLYNPIRWKRILPSRLVRNTQADFFHCSWRQFGNRWKQDLEYYGIPVNVYTVNQLSTYRRMKSIGVAGIFTDRPEMLLKNEYTDTES